MQIFSLNHSFIIEVTLKQNKQHEQQQNKTDSTKSERSHSNSSHSSKHSQKEPTKPKSTEKNNKSSSKNNHTASNSKSPVKVVSVTVQVNPTQQKQEPKNVNPFLKLKNSKEFVPISFSPKA